MNWRYFSAAVFCLTALAFLGDGPRRTRVTAEQPAKEAVSDYQKHVLPYLTKHCFSCHGNGKKKGKISFDGFGDDESILKNRKLWENVIEMVKVGEMPPSDKPRPPKADTDAALKAIEELLTKVDCTGPRNVGRVTIRRLNKTEYNNTIRDLVGIDFQPAAGFPADDVGYGFDNIGDVLAISPLLLEKYLGAAETILDRAIVSVETPKASKNRIGGLRASKGAGDVQKGGGVFLHSSGEVIGTTTIEEGDYVIRAEVYQVKAGDEPVRASLKIGDKNIKEYTVDGQSAFPIKIEAKTRLKAGQTRVALAFLNPFKKDKEQRQLVVRYLELDGPYNPPAIVLPDAHRKIMTHAKDLKPREAAREIVTRFATRAFRRPVKTEEIERLLKLYDRAAKEGERFESSVRLALSGVLVSPHFLFRIELDPQGAKPGATYPINDFNLASRLSYFLWSSMPDDELIALAGKGQLRQNLEAQVARMLKDKKSAAFSENFAGQWLTIRNLSTAAPDPKKFPGFDKDLRDAMYRETEMFFDAILREDRSILDFLDADFSFVNERLAKHYGIAGIKGEKFQRVKLPANRGGILTHASILTLTSNPTRTSPVKRGKWVMEQILGTPPPPPPPDVPDLEEDPKELTGSLRQRLEQHRTKASCAVCHNKMDPLGFAFENYDPTGAWRDMDGKFAIDPSGVLPDGKKFKGPADLKTILKGKKDLFSRCLTEKILTYALGRGVEYYDKCAIDTIVAALDKNDYRFSTLVLETVKSEPFQMRTAAAKK